MPWSSEQTLLYKGKPTYIKKSILGIVQITNKQRMGRF